MPERYRDDVRFKTALCRGIGCVPSAVRYVTYHTPERYFFRRLSSH